MSYTYEYPRPAVTTDAIVFTKNGHTIYLLLIERGVEPYKGTWALPGGFVEENEELDLACARELKEETGITNIGLKQFSTFGAVNRDPRGRTISVVYWAEVTTQLDLKFGDDAINAKWFNIAGLPDLAFDHLEIIQKFLKLNMHP